MFRRGLSAVCLCLVLVSLISCSGGTSQPPGNMPPPGPNTSPVSLTIRDTPPAGVTILSFEVTITSATLQPGNIALVSSPIRIEIRRLEVEAAVLGTLNVPNGTYTGITVTFSNPELTILNNSGASVAGCPDGGVCELRPPIPNATITYTGAPFPISVPLATGTSLQIDFDLLNSIPSSLGSIIPVFTVSTIVAPPGTTVLEEIEDLAGRITAVNAAASEFTLQTAILNMPLVIRTDASTSFEDFAGLGCATSNFACLAVGQLVEVDLRLQLGGMLLATKVEAEDNDNELEVEGIVTRINSPTQFEMALIDDPLNAPIVDIGQLVVVNLLPGVSFRIDDDNFPVNSADFDAASDLLVGQAVEVEIKSTPAGTPPSFDTDRVKLKDSRFTATIQSVDAANNRFTMNALPAIFTAQVPAVTQIDVLVSTGTEFSGTATNFASLAAGNTVSIRGLLFRTAGNPFVVGKKVRRR